MKEDKCDCGKMKGSKEMTLDLSAAKSECIQNGYLLSDKFLGKGSYASVYMGWPTVKKIEKNYKLRIQSKLNTEVKVAIKIISVALAPPKYIRKFLPREIATLNRCYGHKNVIGLFEIFATENRVYLVMEYAGDGTLLDLINKKISKLATDRREPEVRKLFKEIMCGIRYIHSIGISHRDLKCENLLLSCGDKVKIGDFGFAVKTRSDDSLQLTRCGSFAYTAPEILRHKTYEGKFSDIWSLGIVLFAMVNGKLPFKASDQKKILEAMRRPVQIKSWVTEECKDLIRNMLRIRPCKRLRIDDIISHPWMKAKTFEDDLMISQKAEKEEINACPVAPRDYRPSFFDDANNVFRFLQRSINQTKVISKPIKEPNSDTELVDSFQECSSVPRVTNQSHQDQQGKRGENLRKLQPNLKEAAGDTVVSKMFQSHPPREALVQEKVKTPCEKENDDTERWAKKKYHTCSKNGYNGLKYYDREYEKKSTSNTEEEENSAAITYFKKSDNPPASQLYGANLQHRYSPLAYRASKKEVEEKQRVGSSTPSKVNDKWVRKVEKKKSVAKQARSAATLNRNVPVNNQTEKRRRSFSFDSKPVAIIKSKPHVSAQVKAVEGRKVPYYKEPLVRESKLSTKSPVGGSGKKEKSLTLVREQKREVRSTANQLGNIRKESRERVVHKVKKSANVPTERKSSHCYRTSNYTIEEKNENEANTRYKDPKKPAPSGRKIYSHRPSNSLSAKAPVSSISKSYKDPSTPGSSSSTRRNTALKPSDTPIHLRYRANFVKEPNSCSSKIRTQISREEEIMRKLGRLIPSALKDKNRCNSISSSTTQRSLITRHDIKFDEKYQPTSPRHSSNCDSIAVRTFRKTPVLYRTKRRSPS